MTLDHRRSSPSRSRSGRTAPAWIGAALLVAATACSSTTATSTELDAPTGSPVATTSPITATTALATTTLPPTTSAAPTSTTTTTTLPTPPVTTPAPTVDPAALPAIDAAAYGVFDLTAGQWLGEHAVDEQRPVASLVKLLTASVILDAGDLDRVVTVPPMQIAEDESRIWLYTGQQLPRRALVDAMLVASANDAAIALAVDNAGTVEAFVRRMNDAAAALGLAGTRAANPVGLDDAAAVSTVRDLVSLTAALWQSPEFRSAVATHAVEMFGQSFPNTNELLATYPGANGVKTGSTTAAGSCLIASAERDGRTVVVVVLGAPSDDARFAGAMALLDWSFAQR